MQFKDNSRPRVKKRKSLTKPKEMTDKERTDWPREHYEKHYVESTTTTPSTPDPETPDKSTFGAINNNINWSPTILGHYRHRNSITSINETLLSSQNFEEMFEYIGRRNADQHNLKNLSDFSF